MKIAYEGDTILASKFLQQAQQEFYMLKSRGQDGRFVRTFSNQFGKATVLFTYGRYMDGVTIVAHASPRVVEEILQALVPLFFSGVVIGEGQLSERGLYGYAPTVPPYERFGWASSPLLATKLAIRPHPSMPTRMTDMGADSQYTIQRPSMYTGKMCRLVQMVLAYGRLDADSWFTSAINAFRDSHGDAIVLPPSVLWTAENKAIGVRNTFGWTYARTEGVFTRITDDGSPEYWLIQISQADGVKAMPLQLEPVTTLPQFRTFVETERARIGAKLYWNEVLSVLDEFGGFPSNEAFITTDPAIKAKIITLLGPESMTRYVEGRGVSQDHGWAFNDGGTLANAVCLKEHANSWHMAHHCQLRITYDAGLNRPVAEFVELESGSAPVGKHYLKVGESVLDGCVSFNMSLLDHGDYTDRPRADRTAMFVFWKSDRLEVLRWSDGNEVTLPSAIHEVDEVYKSQMRMYYRSEWWGGRTGIGAGFFCTLHDGRIPTETDHSKTEAIRKIGNEKQRQIGYDSGSDRPMWYSRRFWSWVEKRTTVVTGNFTRDCCAFVPLGDRSAFYIATMTEKGVYHDTRSVEFLDASDPYTYAVSDTYVYNSGYVLGEPYPIRRWVWDDATGAFVSRVVSQGLIDVVWDRGGSSGKFQLSKYGQYYIWGPSSYAGGWAYYGITPSILTHLAEWSEVAGQGDWKSIGDDPKDDATSSGIFPVKPFSGDAGATYDNTVGGGTTVSVYFVSMQEVSEVFRRTGPYAAIYRDYNYWFDRSPNSDGDNQNMWAYKNYFGHSVYQLYSTDVNESTLAVNGGYPLPPSDFPTFIGVVGDVVT